MTKNNTNKTTTKRNVSKALRDLTNLHNVASDKIGVLEYMIDEFDYEDLEPRFQRDIEDLTMLICDVEAARDDLEMGESGALEEANDILDRFWDNESFIRHLKLKKGAH